MYPHPETLSGIEDVVILARRKPSRLRSISGRIVEADHRYPAALTPLVMARLFGKVIPAGRTAKTWFLLSERRSRRIHRPPSTPGAFRSPRP